MRWIKTEKISSLPSEPCLYAVYDKRDNRLLYFGKTINLYYRINHPGKGHPGHSRIRYDIGAVNIYIKYRITDLLYLEKSFIKRLNPPYNLQYNSKKKIRRNSSIGKSQPKKDYRIY